jgi:hypothetical protein
MAQKAGAGPPADPGSGTSPARTPGRARSRAPIRSRPPGRLANAVIASSSQDLLGSRLRELLLNRQEPFQKRQPLWPAPLNSPESPKASNFIEFYKNQSPQRPTTHPPTLEVLVFPLPPANKIGCPVLRLPLRRVGQAERAGRGPRGHSRSIHPSQRPQKDQKHRILSNFTKAEPDHTPKGIRGEIGEPQIALSKTFPGKDRRSLHYAALRSR